MDITKSIIKFQYFAVVALLCYRINDGLTKVIVTHLGAFELLFFRSLFTLCVIPFFLFYQKINYKLFLEKNVLLRNLFAAIALFFEVASLKYLTLSEFVLISYTAPIFTTIFARLLLNEEFSVIDCCLILISIVGSIFILDFSFEKTYMQGVLFAFLGAIFYALCLVVTKTVKSEDTSSIYFSYIIMMFLISTWNPPSLLPQKSEFAILFAMAMIHVAAFVFHLKSLRALTASRVVVLEYLGLVFACLLDYIFWNRLLEFHQIVGALFIISASIVSIYRTQARSFFKKLNIYWEKPAVGDMPNSDK